MYVIEISRTFIAKAETFDSEWRQVARGLGLKHNTVSYPLPYKRNNVEYHRGDMNSRAIEYDDQRRGAYVPSYTKNERRPVHITGAALPSNNVLALPSNSSHHNPPRQQR